MNKLTFNININAPKQKVWEVMLDDKTYREWTTAFNEGSYYEGSWEKGSKILFLGPDENGKMGGMVSKIAENIPYEYVSIEHLGVVMDGKEDTESESVKEWVGVHENYIFSEESGVTTLIVELEDKGMAKEMSDMFAQMWPKALEKLKEIAER